MPEQDRIEAVVRSVLANLVEGAKHDVSGSPVTTGFAHGSTGLWSLCGQNQRVYSTMVGIQTLATQLPAFASNETNPIQSYMTGVTAGSGEEPTTNCGEAPKSGLMKTGALVRQFGRYKRQTQTIELNRLGQRINRGDPMDLYLMNESDNSLGALTPTLGQNTGGNTVLVNEIAKRFYELQLEFVRLLATQLYTGNPANNVPLLGYPNEAYGEFSGLQILVNTGYRDAIAGVAIPSLDSDVKSFSDQRVDQNGPGIVTVLTAMTRYLKWKAMASNIVNVNWAFVMRPQMFWALTDVWPCAYNTTNCVAAGTNVGFVDTAAQRQLSDEMRQGDYILIDGQRWPVIIDSYMPETEPVANVFASDIYLVPLRAMGVPTLYWQYFDEGNDQIAQALNMLDNGVRVFDNGAYIVSTSRTRLCWDAQAKVEPRLMLDLPQLAGRVTNVRAWTLQHESDPNPDSGYHQNGGQTVRTGPSLFTPVAA